MSSRSKALMMLFIHLIDWHPLSSICPSMSLFVVLWTTEIWSNKSFVLLYNNLSSHRYYGWIHVWSIALSLSLHTEIYVFIVNWPSHHLLFVFLFFSFLIRGHEISRYFLLQLLSPMNKQKRTVKKPVTLQYWCRWNSIDLTHIQMYFFASSSSSSSSSFMDVVSLSVHT